MQNKTAHLAGVGFSVIFGLTFMFSRILLEDENIPPMGVITYRFSVAFIIFEILRLFKIVKINIWKKKLYPLLIVATLQPVFYFIFETLGVKLTTSAESGLMIALIPIFVALFSAIKLKEKPKKNQIIFILISFSGVLVILLFKPSADSTTNILGIGYLLLAVTSAALYNIASRHASTSFKPQEITYFMMLIGMISFNIIYIIQLIITDNLSSYVDNFLNMHVILPILYLGIIASIGGFFLVNYALSKLPAHVSSIYSNISTIVAFIAGYIFLNESIGIYHIIGGLLIIIGVYATTKTNDNKRRKRGRNDPINQTISQNY